jgi:tRNA(fMet)-specific endonuclease VapC
VHVLLDTSAFSNLRRGHPDVLDRVAQAQTVSLPVVVVGELHAGFEIGSRAAENKRVLAEFINEFFVRTLPVTDTVAERYGALFAALRRNGTPIPVNDIWIAAITVESGGELLTFDSDFEKIENLRVSVLS